VAGLKLNVEKQFRASLRRSPRIVIVSILEARLVAFWADCGMTAFGSIFAEADIQWVALSVNEALWVSDILNRKATRLLSNQGGGKPT